MDARVNRKAPKSIKEYLADIKETIDVFRWVASVLMVDETKQWVKRMLIWMVISVSSSIALPLLIRLVIDGLTERDQQYIMIGIVGYAIIFTINAFAAHRQSVAREWILGLNWGRLDDMITRKFFEKSMNQHILHGSMLSISNIDKGRWKVLDLQGLVLFEGLPVILTTLVSFIALAIISPIAGLIMGIILLVHFSWMLFLNSKTVQECLPIERELRSLNRYRIGRWEAMERVKTSGKEAHESEHMAKRFDESIRKDRKFWVWFIGQSSIRGYINIIAQLAIMLYGVYLVWNGAWTVGLLYPLMSWTMQLTSNIWRFGHLEYQLNWNMPAVKSMKEALEIVPEFERRPDALKLSDTGSEKVSVSFENVSYAYPIVTDPESHELSENSQLHTLKGITFKIDEGEKVALIGESGAGKTTVMRLLLRFTDPTSGIIRVNGHDLRDIDLEDWMHMIGYIPQESQVFDDTIGSNLTYGLWGKNGSIPDKKVWDVMKLLQIDFGKRLDKGLQTRVGKDGLQLSGGQRQRIMIGAAVMDDPLMMVIDEATSNLDSMTERAVQAGLAKVLTDKVSALVVAHRLSTVRDICDKFIVLRPLDKLQPGEQQIEAVATSFEELHDISPTFRQLAQDQQLVV
ncbi:MAG: ABC transporter ATP-binding protein [Patescibacteria group bacterium]